MHLIKEVPFLCAFLLVFFRTAYGISCYQCLSRDHENPFQCPEYMDDSDIEPTPCEAIYGSQYCVKHTGRFEVLGISCYQCSSTEVMDCSDILIHEGALSPGSCDDIFEANHCIKTTGFYRGGLGTKRFCSPLDLGNYCNYIKQPGDELEYRSCVYTCSTDGCNSTSEKYPLGITSLLLIGLAIIIFYRQ
ncbi:UPAR/Ly6 domain-containing protein bou [Anabrus simplex]|uniref:UPAR/Ly6 domain-containing protein bou n=1 Tax=Anabrus simplex TaxID=316456 RepID=UPI0034DD583B